MIPISDVVDTYRKMSDQELIDLSIFEARSLTTHAKAVLKLELSDRRLGEPFIRSIDAQRSLYTEDEFLRYSNMLAQLDCPICKESNGRLNSTLTGEVISLVVMTEYWTSFKLGCRKCLDKANRNAIIKTAVFGWWGIPFGIIRTVQSLMLNVKHRRLIQTEANSGFRDFVVKNVGVLEAYGGSRERLLENLIRLNGL
jgi:hypothetical protein